MPVTHEEMQGSPREFRDREGFKHERRLMVDWSSRLALMNELLLGGGQVYPHDPTTLSRARSATARPFPGGVIMQGGFRSFGSGIKYEKAIVTVIYESPRPGDPTPNGSGEFISEILEPSAEFLTLDHTLFRWGPVGSGDHLNEQEAPGRIVKTLDYVFTRHDVSAIPLAALTLLGTVNDSTVTANFLGVTFEPETLLYNPPRIERRIDTDGTQKMKIAYRFTYKPEGWNVFWRSKTQAFEPMFVAGNEESFRNYKLGDFTVL